MLIDIVEAEPLDNYHLFLRFEDGIEGIVDIRSLVEFTGVFKPLKDQNNFSSVAVNPEWGTVYWPNGADLDPDVLYSVITGKEIPELDEVSPSPSDANVKDDSFSGNHRICP